MSSYADDQGFRAEVEQRLGRPFPRVQEQLCALFAREWDEVEVFIATSATKRDRSEVDVIEDLIGKAEVKPAPQQVVRKAVVRFIGKPWRERENPWDRYKDRVPRGTDKDRDPLGPPPDTSGAGDDPWEPVRPED